MDNIYFFYCNKYLRKWMVRKNNAKKREFQNYEYCYKIGNDYYSWA